MGLPTRHQTSTRRMLTLILYHYFFGIDFVACFLGLVIGIGAAGFFVGLGELAIIASLLPLQ
jgi:hypothetical protein